MNFSRIALCISTFCIGISFGAANVQWEYTNVPYYDAVTALTVCGNALLAGSDHGIVRSTDSGKTWRSVTLKASLDKMPVEFFCPVNGDTILVKAYWTMLSVDKGNSWNQLNAPSRVINAATVTSGRFFVSQKYEKGIMTSADHGTTWVNTLDTGIIDTAILSLASHKNALFAGTRSSGIFMSTNNGSNWIPIDSGIPVKTARVFPAINRLYADSSFVIAVLDSEIYTFADSNRTWTEISAGIPPGHVHFVTAHGNRIFAGNDSGLFCTTTNGTTWTSLSSGLPVNPVTGNKAVFTCAFDNTTMYSGTCQGVYRSMDNGLTWTAAGSMTTISSLACLGTKLFCGTNQGILSSTDNGDHWTLGDSAVRLTNVIATRSNLLVAGTGAGTWQGRVFFSTDSGNLWKNNKFGTGTFADKIIALAITDSGVFAGLNGFEGIDRTTNSGYSWNDVSGDLVANPYVSHNVNTSFLAARGTTVFSTVQDSFYRTENNGKNWIRSDRGIKGVVNAFTATQGFLFAGTPSGIFKTAQPDTGWNAVLTVKNITDLASVGTNVFAATADSGVYFSDDNGIDWKPLGSGLKGYRVTRLVYGNMVLFAGVEGGGVYRIPLTEFVSSRPLTNPAAKPALPATVRIVKNRTDITLSLQKPEHVGISILDLSGRTVAIIADGCMPSGMHTLSWENAGKATGCYLLSIQTDAGVKNRVLSVMK